MKLGFNMGGYQRGGDQHIKSIPRRGWTRLRIARTSQDLTRPKQACFMRWTQIGKVLIMISTSFQPTHIVFMMVSHIHTYSIYRMSV